MNLRKSKSPQTVTEGQMDSSSPGNLDNHEDVNAKRAFFWRNRSNSRLDDPSQTRAKELSETFEAESGVHGLNKMMEQTPPPEKKRFLSLITGASSKKLSEHVDGYFDETSERTMTTQESEELKHAQWLANSEGTPMYDEKHVGSGNESSPRASRKFAFPQLPRLRKMSDVEKTPSSKEEHPAESLSLVPHAVISEHDVASRCSSRSISLPKFPRRRASGDMEGAVDEQQFDHMSVEGYEGYEMTPFRATNGITYNVVGLC